MRPRYCVGDATRPHGGEPKVIVHIVNTKGVWGAGFVLSLSRRWPEPERHYRTWYRDGIDRGVRFGLGSVQFVAIKSGLWVGNMVAQEGYGFHRAGPPPIRYDALRTCLAQVGKFAGSAKASVCMPRIGTGLAGGLWNLIEPIITEEICGLGVDVIVYDLP